MKVKPKKPDLMAEAVAAVKGKKPSKYRNVRTIYNGEKYDSKSEAARAAYWDGRYSEGFRYLRQPRFALGVPENVYRGDFFVWNINLELRFAPITEDVKGAWTAKFKRDVKLWKAYGPTNLVIVTGKKTEVIEGGKATNARYSVTTTD